MNELGVDYSHWDGQVNWDVAKAAKVKFAFVKASQGIAYKDVQYDRNLAEAKRVGIPLGPYHYYEPWQDPIKQADWFCQAAPVGGGLPHVADIEDTRSIPSGYGAKVLQFLQRVEVLTKVRPIIYTGWNYWTSYLGDLGWALDYKLWIANYRYDAPMVPKPWAPMTWAYWQYTAHGNAKRYGSQKSYVDLNVAQV